jgi:CheY-like chemotaxis protein
VSNWNELEEQSWSGFEALLRATPIGEPPVELRSRCLPPGLRDGAGAGPEPELVVLVVDDEPNIRRLIQHHLTRHGYGVELAHDGRQALESLQARRPDLILLDVMMPGMDGFDVLRHIKDDPDTAGIPVMMLTAKSADDDIRHGWGTGADWYMTKPFNPEELCFLVARMAAVIDTPDNPPPLRRYLK